MSASAAYIKNKQYSKYAVKPNYKTYPLGYKVL